VISEIYLSSDYLVYNHFKKIFERKLEQFGKEKMEKELNMLEEANSNIRVSALNINFFFLNIVLGDLFTARN